MMSSFIQSDKSCSVVAIIDFLSRKINTGLVESNMVSAKRIFEIAANEKVHMTIKFDCKQ